MVELLLGNLLNVLDRLIQLSTYRQQARQKLLEQHTAPVFAAFEAVHGQYLSSFEKYRKILKTTTEPLTPSHPILDEIRTDNLFTEHQRTRMVFRKTIPTSTRR